MKIVCLGLDSKRQEQISKAFALDWNEDVIVSAFRFWIICATSQPHGLVSLLLGRQDYVTVPLASHTLRTRPKGTEAG